jgi:hypothetical protein
LPQSSQRTQRKARRVGAWKNAFYERIEFIEWADRRASVAAVCGCFAEGQPWLSAMRGRR